uniref:Uracil phosphoribosyltransferase n=1 Tax=Titanophycus setchellii TaxID=940129 RepID=A0A1G4NYU7_9FLOR|nr:Uracil phosphoribosyltransferase [Titanophycus setchellii]SCW23696.1 Uracil phosphoribosyltransferase [Titanophycus setchellii]
MPINIYTVKHPLVLNWTNHLIHRTNHHNDHQELIGKISLALIYEVCRNTMENQTLYIKYIYQIHKIWLITNQNISLFCSDLQILQAISKDIYALVPSITIYPLIAEEKDHTWQITIMHKSWSRPGSLNNIIILENKLKTNKIHAIIKHIHNTKKANPKIHICCNQCNTTELDNLGQRYSKLNIYTGYIEDSVR